MEEGGSKQGWKIGEELPQQPFLNLTCLYWRLVMNKLTLLVYESALTRYVMRYL